MPAKRIDDIRPVTKPRPLAHLTPYAPPAHKGPQPPVTHLAPAKAGPQSPIVNDGMMRPNRPTGPRLTQPMAKPRHVLPHQPEPRLVASPSASSESAPARPAAKTKRRASKWRVFLELIQYPVFAAVALLAASNSTVGQWFVLAYAVVAITMRLRSQVSFGIALFLLIAIPIFQLMDQPGIAQNIAVYVYELLVVGTLQAILELYKTRHKKQADT